MKQIIQRIFRAMQIIQSRRTGFFTRQLSDEEQLQRIRARREATRRRTAEWRQRLADRNAPEERQIASAALAAFLATGAIDDETNKFTREFLSRITAAGYDPVQVLHRAKSLRRKLVDA